MRDLLRGVALGALLVMGGARTAYGLEAKVSAQALERTLRAQLFNGPQGRYYVRGDATTAFLGAATGSIVAKPRSFATDGIRPQRSESCRSL